MGTPDPGQFWRVIDQHKVFSHDSYKSTITNLFIFSSLPFQGKWTVLCPYSIKSY